ncbi:hypothetical protein O181_100339 [Austropuccinia psidii MF-1]|uniref:Uncharacterized protein n=1 Tax=Austropuccinia psidii MF-1 TaxID=1389203 RepID=A0A9Q3JEG6_9BASI|nr:hypothetical protein [Austropuccinia psidii MF-1]
MDYSLWAVEAIGALDPMIVGVRPKALVIARWARSAWKTRWTPQAQNKGIGLGVGEVENQLKGPMVSGCCHMVECDLQLASINRPFNRFNSLFGKSSLF